MSWRQWDDEVVAAAMKAARDVRSRHPNGMELEDLEQEAHIYIATHAETVQRHIDKDGVRYAEFLIRSHLDDLSLRESKRQSRQTDYEGWAEPWRE